MSVIKSSFFWQMASGFALGVIGVVALQPPEATRTLVSRIAPSGLVAR